MSRIHEEYSKTRDNAYSIKVGLKESGPVIIAAALIMFSVFFAFVFQEDVMIKSMGMALSFGVLFDAFVVRMMIIPALTQLFGKASWYLPGWLSRIIPHIDIEGHALESMKTPSGDSYQRHRHTENYTQSFNIASTPNASSQELNQSSMRTIQVDQPTYELYHAIQQHTHDTHFLYRALKNYQQQQTDHFDDSRYNQSELEITQLLQTQSDNIKQLNELIAQQLKQNKK